MNLDIYLILVQILSRAIGGKIGRAINGWDVGVNTVNLSPSKLLSALQIPSVLTIIECHQDEVCKHCSAPSSANSDLTLLGMLPSNL